MTCAGREIQRLTLESQVPDTNPNAPPRSPFPGTLAGASGSYRPCATRSMAIQ